MYMETRHDGMYMYIEHDGMYMYIELWSFIPGISICMEISLRFTFPGACKCTHLPGSHSHRHHTHLWKYHTGPYFHGHGKSHMVMVSTQIEIPTHHGFPQTWKLHPGPDFHVHGNFSFGRISACTNCHVYGNFVPHMRPIAWEFQYV